MMHQISAGRFQRFDELKSTFGFYERLNDQLGKMLADASGQKFPAVKRDMKEDVWMDAKQAKRSGFVDEII